MIASKALVYAGMAFLLAVTVAGSLEVREETFASNKRTR